MPKNTIKQDKPMYGSEQTVIKKTDTLCKIDLLNVKPNGRYRLIFTTIEECYL